MADEAKKVAIDENDYIRMTRPDRHSFKDDNAEFYRWFEHGGKERERPLDASELREYLKNDRGYAEADAAYAVERDSMARDGDQGLWTEIQAMRDKQAEQSQAALDQQREAEDTRQPVGDEREAGQEPQQLDLIEQHPEHSTAAREAEALQVEQGNSSPREPASSSSPAVDAAAEPERPKAREATASELQFDEAAKGLLAARRAADREAALSQLEENAIMQARVREYAAAKRQGAARPAPDGGDNEVQSDEVFHTAEEDRKPLVPKDTMPPDIDKHFLKVGKHDYHFQKNPDTVAFSDRGNKLETKSNSAFVADTMVKIALARGWDEIKVTGSETFKREVWFEAASRGMSVKGYQPNDVDKAKLEAYLKRQPRTHEGQNTLEPVATRGNQPVKSRQELMAHSFRNDSPDEAIKKFPELAPAYAGVEAQRRRVQAEQLTATQTQVALERINRNAANSIEKGKIPAVQVEERERTEAVRVREAEVNRAKDKGVER